MTYFCKIANWVHLQGKLRVACRIHCVPKVFTWTPPIYSIFMRIFNKNILKYVEIVVTDANYWILDIDGYSIKHMNCAKFYFRYFNHDSHNWEDSKICSTQMLFLYSHDFFLGILNIDLTTLYFGFKKTYLLTSLKILWPQMIC